MSGMTVKMPDGTIIRNVPEGTTRAELERKYGAHVAKTAKVERPTVGGSLLDSAKNLGARMLEGAAAIPDAVNEATHAIGKGVVLGGVTVADPLLRGLGADRAANAVKGFGERVERDRPRTIGGLTQQYIPQTPGHGVTDFATQMLGGAMFPLAPKVTPRISAPRPVAAPRGVAAQALAPAKAAGQAVVKEGDRAGVRVMTTDVIPPKTFVGRSVQKFGERIPIIGTGGKRAAQQAERVEAVRNIAREYGAASGDDLAKPAIDDVMVDFAKTRGAAVAKHAAEKKAVIEGTPGVVATPNTIAALDAQIAKFSKVGTPASQALVGKLQGWKEAVAGGKDLPTMDLIRAEMGEAFKDPSLASIKTAGEKALQGIYGPMKTDMGTFIRNVGGPDAMVQWNRANTVLSGMADELQVSTLRSVLRSGKGTPEDVAKILFSNKPSLVRRLIANTSPDGRARAQAAILQKVLEKSGGMESTSPAKFVTQVGALGKSIGVVFPPDDLARIEGLSRLLKATARAADAGVSTNTGQDVVPMAIGAVAWAHPYLVGGGALLARAYESAPVRNALLGLGKVKPGTPAYAIRLDRANGAIAAVIGNLEKRAAMNDNVGVAAAAGDSPEQQREQQPALQP